MKKVLFLIHNLGPGGAEKVLVNTVNNMDKTQYDVTVMTLFDVGVNKQFLNSDIHFHSVFPKMFRGNSHFFKIFSPEFLHKMFIKEQYDVEISYLEGPCARIISGCPNKKTKLLSWIHIELHGAKQAAASFRSKSEAEKCYNRFHHIVCVSEGVKQAFTTSLSITTDIQVIYNPIDRNRILSCAKELIDDYRKKHGEFVIVGVGKLIREKGFDRLIRVVGELKKSFPEIRLHLLGCGSEQQNLEKLVIDCDLKGEVTFLGYQINPYKYIAQCDLFVCPSFREGYSTATIEAMILGLPVCTVLVSGMTELLGNNEYGMIVENDENALKDAVLRLLSDSELLQKFKSSAQKRGELFCLETSLESIDKLID